jgi:tellurite resistance protein
MRNTVNRAASVIDQCKYQGQRLCKSFRAKTTGKAETSYLLEPSGKPVTSRSAEEAIKTGLLVGCNDGLFDSADSQTWAARR